MEAQEIEKERATGKASGYRQRVELRCAGVAGAGQKIEGDSDGTLMRASAHRGRSGRANKKNLPGPENVGNRS